MNDNDFLRLLDDYLNPASDPNPDMLGIELIWEQGNPKSGSLHIWQDHYVTEEEVEQVLFEIPPYVEARRHPYVPNRTWFWGATRFKRWLFISCEDWESRGKRFLKPITAYEPPDGVKYWEKIND